jgi:HlyD family secretion protein
MTRRFCCWLLCFVTLVSLSSLARAGEPAKKNGKAPAKTDKPATKPADEASAASPATYTVKKKPFKIAIELEGIFEAETAREIFVKPEEWNTLTVKSAVPHGAPVREGDMLLTLETDKLDRAIADLRAELKLSEVSIRQSEDQLRVLDQTVPLDLESSGRAARIAQEDRKYFVEVEQPFALKAADFGLKVAKQTLEYEEEELRQLEKMYKADDITEETEQIVLKRARDTVERAKFMLQYATLNHDEAVKYTIPRREASINDLAKRKSLDWEKNKVELPLALQRQRLELEKLRLQRERSDDRLQKLLGDRKLMTVKSPIDGIVYYGKCVRGRFSDSSTLAESLRPEGSIMPNQVFMTVVRPRPVFIRATVPEEQLHYLRPGLKGIATPAGYPDLRLPTTIDRVGDVPTAPGSFDARLAVVLDRGAKWLMPGMTCKVKLVPYLKKEAVSVPPKAISADELDDQKHFVYVLDKDNKPQKRAVTLGEKSDKQVEIVKGLSEGDKVSSEAPKEQK